MEFLPFQLVWSASIDIFVMFCPVTTLDCNDASKISQCSLNFFLKSGQKIEHRETLLEHKERHKTGRQRHRGGRANDFLFLLAKWVKTSEGLLILTRCVPTLISLNHQTTWAKDSRRQGWDSCHKEMSPSGWQCRTNVTRVTSGRAAQGIGVHRGAGKWL